MKTGIIVASLLILSLFAGAFVSAQQGADDMRYRKLSVEGSVDAVAPTLVASGSVDSDALESDLNVDDISAVVAAELEASGDVPSTWRQFPALAFWGQGYATSSDDKEGYFVKLVGVSKEYATDPDNSLGATTVTTARLKVGNENYKISAKYATNSNTDSLETITFDVMHDGSQVGTFTLKTKQSLQGNFKLREGTLKLNSGKSYDITLATDSRVVNKVKIIQKRDEEKRTKDKTSADDDSTSDKTDDSDATVKAAREAAKVAKDAAKEQLKEERRWWQFWKKQGIDNSGN